jgi:hypothetical protein
MIAKYHVLIKDAIGELMGQKLNLFDPARDDFWCGRGYRYAEHW